MDSGPEEASIVSRMGDLTLRIAVPAMILACMAFCGCGVTLEEIQKTENVAQLKRWTGAEKGWVREYSAWRLGALAEPTATGDLVRLLEDEYPWVRLRAADALGQTKDRSAIEPMIRALERERDIDVRCALIRALGRMPGSASEEAISRNLHSRHLLVKGAARNALRRQQ